MFLAETVETGDKNRDDFHFMQMQLVMSMWFIFSDDWRDPPSWICFGFLAMIKFSPNQGPWFSWIHILVLKNKYPEEYSTEILFRGVLRRYLSQNIDAITGTLWLNRFDIADSTGAHCWSQQFLIYHTVTHKPLLLLEVQHMWHSTYKVHLYRCSALRYSETCIKQTDLGNAVVSA